MNLNLKNITFIIVTFKSENFVHECIKSLPQDSSKIVIENSKNIKLKQELEKKYDNIEVIINENIGMGASNNIGIKKSRTRYAYIINPDVRFKKDTLEKIFEIKESIPDFSIISPVNSDPKYPNYKIKNVLNDINDNIISVDHIDGFSMLIDKNKFQDNNFFDENFFLYLENSDLCLRVKKSGGSIFIVPTAKITHTGSKAVDPKYKDEVELSRNWHWIWSKFYFNKKNFGIFKALTECFPTFISSIFRILFYILINNNYKKKIYLNRISGFYNALMGRNSWYRPKI